MFDDLRKEGDASPFFQQEQDVEPLLDAPKKKSAGGGFSFKPGGKRKFLGMTAFQRFVISTLIFVMVGFMGLMFLVVTGTVSIF